MSYAETPVRPVGGRLVLDFLNTADWSAEGDVIHEKLTTGDDVRSWTDALGITQSVVDGRSHDLMALRNMRTELRRLIQAAIEDHAPDAQTINQLNLLLASTSNASLMVKLTNRPWLAFESTLLDLILASAKSVLADPREISRVNMCSGPDCGWLFLDESRNQQRRWCMMQTCGNRAKARRHYANRASQNEI